MRLPGVKRWMVVLAALAAGACQASSTAHSASAPPATSPASPTPGTSTVSLAPAPCPPQEAVSLSWVSPRVGWLVTARSCNAAFERRLYRTDDAGRSWQRRPLHAPGRASDVAFASREVGYLFSPGMQITQDGGRHWHAVAGRATTALAVAGQSAYRVTYRGTGCPGPCHLRIEKSSTGSATWRPVDLPPEYGVGANISASGETVLVTLPGHTAGGAPDAHTGYVLSTDGGVSWRTLTDPCGGHGRHEWDTTAVAVSGHDIVAACGLRARARSAVVISHDDGGHFTQRRPVPMKYAAAVGEVGGRILVGSAALVGSGAVTYEVATSTDDAHSWSMAVTDHAEAGDADVDVSAAISCAGSSCVYRADPRRIFVSLDGGRTWRPRPVPR